MSGKKTSFSHRAKTATVKIAMKALGIAYEMASKSDPRLKAEIADWNDGRVVSLGVLPSGPSMSIKKEGDRIRFLGMESHDPEMSILFKNMDCALIMFTGQIGAYTGFSQHRAIVHGSITEAMEVTRTLLIVQTYLFPKFLLNKIFKRPPEITGSQLLLKAKIMALLMPMLALK